MQRATQEADTAKKLYYCNLKPANHRETIPKVKTETEIVVNVELTTHSCIAQFHHIGIGFFRDGYAADMYDEVFFPDQFLFQ